jgi:hypothetical protein
MGTVVVMDGRVVAVTARGPLLVQGIMVMVVHTGRHRGVDTKRLTGLYTTISFEHIEVFCYIYLTDYDVMKSKEVSGRCTISGQTLQRTRYQLSFL